MSDYYWQQSLPTPLQIDYIKQIIYKVEYADPEETMVKVTSTNLYLKITEDRVLLPGRYFTFIKLFFMEAQSKPYANFRPTLLRNIVHLDNIIEALIRPSIGMKEEDIPTHRCPSFEEFLVTEYLIGRHDPESVNNFRAHCPTNLERLVDSFEMDWGRYRDWIPDCFIGEEYDWEVDSVPDEDLPKMWDEVVDWYSQELDPLWISQWVEWDEGLGSKDEEKGTDAGGSDGEIDPKNMSDGKGAMGGEGRNENEEEGSEGSNDMGKNDGGGEQDSDVPPPPNQASLAVTQKRRLSEGSNEEEGGQRKRPSPNPPAARPDREGDQPIGFSQDLLQMIGRPLPVTHWSPPLDSDMIESQVDFPLESFCQVAAGDDEMATHGDIPPVNQRSGRDPGGSRKGKGGGDDERIHYHTAPAKPEILVHPQTVLAHDFDMINVTRGGSYVLKTIPGIVRSLAKGCKDGADVQAIFLNLRAISKVHGQKVTDVFSHLKATNEMHRMIMADAAYLGLHLQKMERMEDMVIDINVKKGYVILANQSGLGMKKNA
ncbi:hypothetical protein BKA82DRAFT_4019519 [Pisolithus tinctorius]|nr:hypothetical protein BKA82DRAFT_4019519 [Pisolithus tinctorius]